MGVKEGAQLAVTAANIKDRRAQQLSEEEKDKIRMEIFKMNAEMSKMNAETSRMNAEVREKEFGMAQAKNQIEMTQKYNALINAEKLAKAREKTFGDPMQFLQAGGGFDTRAMASEYVSEAAPYMKPEALQKWVAMLQPKEKEHRYGYTEEEAKDMAKFRHELSKRQSPMSKMELIAKAAGVNPDKLKDRTVTEEEVIKILNLSQKYGASGLAAMFMGILSQNAPTAQQGDMRDAFGD